MVKWPYPPLHLHSGRRSVPASRALASPLLPTSPLLDFLPIFPETSIAFHLQALTHRVSLDLATSKKSTAIFVCSIIYIHQHKTLSFPCCRGIFGFPLLILRRRLSLFGLLPIQSKGRHLDPWLGSSCRLVCWKSCFDNWIIAVFFLQIAQSSAISDRLPEF